MMDYIGHGEEMKAKAKAMYEKACAVKGVPAGSLATMDFSGALGDLEALEKLGLRAGVLQRKAEIGDDDKWGVGELVLLGLKGTMAYYHHATMLGEKRHDVMDFLVHALNKLNATAETPLNDLLGLALQVGEFNLAAMDALDHGHTSKFGNPSPHQVRTSAKAGKAILVSGHDIVDLHRVLEETAGKGINVYTHGELMPAHGYPNLRSYPHFVGHYGGPWQLQKMEFSRFPGPIILTSNCLMEPQKRYKDRLFTMNMVGFEGVKHIGPGGSATLSDVIQSALNEPGFVKDEPETTMPVGFGHHAILSMADTIVEHVKSGDIKRFFVIGGCDGHEAERSYFTELAQALPNDAVVLTMGCGKYRINKLPWETTAGGIPRLLDMGQCNDSIGAVKVAVALAKAFDTDVNSLPLTTCLSWFEQKAVAVLLSLLHLNIQNIRLGPHLPAFCTPGMLAILQEKFAIKPAGDVQTDLKNMMQGK
jgi:hydroxylamine reductase